MKKIKKPKHSSKIKIQIIVKFMSSTIVAFMVSACCILAFFVALEHVWVEQYIELVDWYNNSFQGQILVMCVWVLLFIVNTFLIFMFKMNSITDAIDELSKGIGMIAEGEFNQKIIVRQKNELGKLANDVNIMAQKLRDSAQKERLWNQQRYNMITNLSHDLKTPMMSIMGYVDFITEKKYRNEQELEAYCNIIERKTKELNHNINQLFQLSKFTSYDYKLVKKKIYVKEFAEQILMGYIPQFKENSMIYDINISADTTINADVDSLKRLFENLISNTIKYAADGKKIEIEARRETDKTILIFRNFGSVIDNEDLNKIFQKFYRRKENSVAEGSGYGLYIVKRIVELHDGSINVNSSESCTEFIIMIP